MDGAVPSFKSATNKEGTPVISYENWQQGLMVVHLRDDDHEYSVEMIEINKGKAIWRGQEYSAHN